MPTYTRGDVKKRIEELKKGVTLEYKAYWRNGCVVQEIPDPLNPSSIRTIETHIWRSLYNDKAMELEQVESGVREAKRDATFWQKFRGYFVGWRVRVNLAWCKKKYDYESNWKGEETIKEVK